mgnify:CR=1 FL=1|tara:strand:+ start:9394 stop:9888 length:495 start_codon:yes stop_codon:yes gene_type:complete
MGSIKKKKKTNYKLLHLCLMQKHNNIKALFFLGIFSLLLLHNIVPHTHHQHEVEHSHKDVAHNDGHNHNHDIPEKENSTKGLLDLFLEVHEHSVASSNETVVVPDSTVIKLNVNKDISTSVSVNHFRISTNFDETEKVTVYHPPNTYFNLYLSSLDSRGPPSLG